MLTRAAEGRKEGTLCKPTTCPQGHKSPGFTASAQPTLRGTLSRLKLTAARATQSVRRQRDSGSLHKTLAQGDIEEGNSE